MNREHGSGPEPDLTLFEPLAAVVRELDPEGVPVPVLDPGITDARYFARLGIQSYGFIPTRLPPGFDRYRLVHGPDERVPVESLRGGADALHAALPSIIRGQESGP